MEPWPSRPYAKFLSFLDGFKLTECTSKREARDLNTGRPSWVGLMGCECKMRRSPGTNYVLTNPRRCSPESAHPEGRMIRYPRTKLPHVVYISRTPSIPVITRRFDSSLLCVSPLRIHLSVPTPFLAPTPCHCAPIEQPGFVSLARKPPSVCFWNEIADPHGYDPCSRIRAPIVLSCQKKHAVEIVEAQTVLSGTEC